MSDISVSRLSNDQLIKWYESNIKQDIARARENSPGYLSSVPAGTQGRQRHDIWSMYDYGGVLKIVYIKNAPKNKEFGGLWDAPPPKQERAKTQKPDEERFSQSVSRTKGRIFELAMCNEFTHFCTFTQDEKLRDRFELAEFRKDFAMMVRNLNRGRVDKVKYLLIPEQHKDGAWHMHGLLMGLGGDDLRAFTLCEKLPTKIRKSLEKGDTVYDWTRYRRAFGYFTCTEIKSGVACSKYITKYISKDLQKSVRDAGEHLFFASQGLNSRGVIVKNCTDRPPVDAWDFENDYVKVKEIQLPGNLPGKKLS